MFHAPQRIERMSTPCKRCGRAARKSAKGTCALCRTPHCTSCADGFRSPAGGDRCCPGCTALIDQLGFDVVLAGLIAVGEHDRRVGVGGAQTGEQRTEHVAYDHVCAYGGFTRTIWAGVVREELVKIGLLTATGRKTRAALDILLCVKLAAIGRAA